MKQEEAGEQLEEAGEQQEEAGEQKEEEQTEQKEEDKKVEQTTEEQKDGDETEQVGSLHRPRGFKILFSCSTQLSMKFILLINVKMPTIVGILTFISRINSTSESS